jgi:hypothetical protein
MLSAPFRETAAPYAIRRASPTLGQDNVDVFTRLLKWSEATIADLSERRIIGTEAYQTNPKVAKASGKQDLAVARDPARGSIV